MQNHDDNTIDLEHAALVLIEFQREWLAPDGKMGAFVPEIGPFADAAARAAHLLAAARVAGLPVAHVGYQFRAGHPELGHATLGLRKTLREYDMFTGASARFADGFEPRPDEFVVAGRLGVSAFAGSDLEGYLRNNRIERLYLAGFALQTCVESTLRDAHDRGYEAYVVEDATAAFSPEQRAYVLDQVLPLFGGRVTVDALMAAMRTPVGIGHGAA